jgi:hypothetical protein
MSGARTRNGTIVTSRDVATRPRAASVGTAKKIVLASAV